MGKQTMTKDYYYLYVYSVDMTGRNELITGKLFFDSETAIDKAKENISYKIKAKKNKLLKVSKEG